MIYSMKIMVSDDRNSIAKEHRPVVIETISNSNEIAGIEIDNGNKSISKSNLSVGRIPNYK